MILGVLGWIGLASIDNEGKVNVLHNGKVIEINNSALEAHLNHGDEIMILYEGEYISIVEYEQIIKATEMADVNSLYYEEPPEKSGSEEDGVFYDID